MAMYAGTVFREETGRIRPLEGEDRSDRFRGRVSLERELGASILKRQHQHSTRISGHVV